MASLHVAALELALVVLLEGHGGGEAREAVFVGEDAADVGGALHPRDTAVELWWQDEARVGQKNGITRR